MIPTMPRFSQLPQQIPYCVMGMEAEKHLLQNPPPQEELPKSRLRNLLYHEIYYHGLVCENFKCDGLPSHFHSPKESI
jgi:hypothetical protein